MMSDLWIQFQVAQIRQNLKKGIDDFEISLIKLDEGTFYKNSFKVVGSTILEKKDTNILVKWLRELIEKVARVYIMLLKL